MAVQSRHVHPHQLLWSHHKLGAVFPSHPPVRLSPQQIESPLSAVTSHRQPGARTHVGWYCTAYSRMVALHRAHCATAEREAAIDLTKPIGRFIKSADRIKSAERSLERHCRELSILWGTVSSARHCTPPSLQYRCVPQPCTCQRGCNALPRQRSVARLQLCLAEDGHAVRTAVPAQCSAVRSVGPRAFAYVAK
jgi:hypothetical protein